MSVPDRAKTTPIPADGPPSDVAQRTQDLVEHSSDVDQHSQAVALGTQEVKHESAAIAAVTHGIAEQATASASRSHMQAGVDGCTDDLEQAVADGGSPQTIAESAGVLQIEIKQHTDRLTAEAEQMAADSQRVAERSSELARRAKQVDGLAKDLTLKTQELALRTQELAHYRDLNEAILNSAGQGIFGVDAEGLVSFANPVSLAALGYSTDGLMGMPLSRVLEVGDAPVTESGARVGWLKRQDGTRLAIEYVRSPIPPSGHVDGAVIVYQDLSERKRLEEALKQQNEQLVNLGRVKTELLQSVSHELRAPLTSVQGYAEFLEDNLGGELSPSQAGFVQEIKRGVERLKRHIDDLLDYSRLEGGTFALSRSPQDLNRLVADVVTSFEPSARLEGQQVDTALAADLPLASLDSRRIEQVLYNLLGNALKFSRKAGVIQVRTLRAGNSVVCEVEDHGVGLNPDEVPRLFQRFTQLDQGLRLGVGAGLGLSISKTIIESHQGEIGVRSTPGVGSTFWFALPVDPAA